MSDIINTGLGWWANEDWLKSNIGQIASVESGTITWPQEPKIPNAAANAATFNGSLYVGNIYSNQRAVFTYDNDAVFVAMYKTGTDTYNVYMASRSRFTWNGIIKSSGGTYSIYNTVHQTSTLNSLGFYEASGFGGAYTLSTIPANITKYTSIENARNAFDSFHPIQYNVSKLNSGYAIACGIKYINRNMETVTAPVLVSSVSDYTKFSLDGSTETPGLLTGIEFGGMTFYVNILLLGVSEGYTFSCEYADITSTYPGGANVTDIFRAIATLSQLRFTDPYAEGGTSGTGGGGGTFDLDSDNVPLPTLPSISFAATGFTRIYNPTLSELNALANYMWTDTTFLDTVINHLKQLLENPMDAIISLALLPCPIPNGTPESVKVMFINTGVSMAPATTQFVDVDCGTYTLQEFYGSALDYNPYTKVHCYLPYIGQVTLDADEVMGRTIHVKYRIDIVTGMCAALISVDRNGGMDETVLYQFSGHCSINMPINSADFSGYIGAAMTAGKMVAGVVAGAAGAPALAAELIGAPAPHSSTSETSEKTTQRNPNTGRQVTSGTSTRTTTRNTPGASFGELARKAAANTVGAVMGSKLTVEHAGGFTGNSGYLAVRRPYLIIERPRMCNPEEYGRYNGRPSMIYMSLSDCSGYTEVQSIQFEGISATNPELSELSELLKSGVIF